MIHILVVDEIKLRAALLGSSLSKKGGINVVDTITSIDTAVARSSECDIFLVNAAFENDGARRLTIQATRLDPRVKVIVTGILQDHSVVIDYIKSGVAGYVFEDHSVEDIFCTIRAVHNNEALVSPAIAAALMKSVANCHRAPLKRWNGFSEKKELTSREEEVLELLEKGNSNQAIADQLYIELGTVKNHVHSILGKLGVRSREEAASYSRLSDTEV